MRNPALKTIKYTVHQTKVSTIATKKKKNKSKKTITISNKGSNQFSFKVIHEWELMHDGAPPYLKIQQKLNRT
jgi:archaellum component FlaF (FlaF/FlaG flagellin family)